MGVEILDPQMRPLAFKPNSWPQMRGLTTTAREALYSGHLGSSKTRTMCEKADLINRQWPNVRGVIARKKRVDLGISTLRCLLEKVVTPSHAAWGWRPGADGGSTLFYPNGSQVLCVGFDNPMKLLSAEFDYILIDQGEETSEENWRNAAGRLRNKAAGFRQIMAFVNPASPDHFLYSKFKPDRSHVERSTEPFVLPDGRSVPAGRVIRECILAGLHDNSENLEPEYLALIHSYKGKWYDRYVLGKWVAFEGIVYDNWDANVHVRPRPVEWAKWKGLPPPDWPIYRAIDFGYVNPFVCQWWARDPEGTAWMFREIYMSRRTVVQHAKDIRAIERTHLDTLRACEKDNAAREGRSAKDIKYLNLYNSISDHDAGDRALLETEDVITDPAVKDVSAGIQTVYNLLQPYEVDGVVKSRLVFIDDARCHAPDDYLVAEGAPTCSREEFSRYRYTDKRETVLTEEPREAPFKKNDHGCDATRMLWHTLATIGDVSVLRV